jgi:hypothetical protein
VLALTDLVPPMPGAPMLIVTPSNPLKYRTLVYGPDPPPPPGGTTSNITKLVPGVLCNKKKLLVLVEANLL